MPWRSLLVILALAGALPARAQGVDLGLATHLPSYIQELDHAMALCMSPKYRNPDVNYCTHNGDRKVATCDSGNHPISWIFPACESIEKKWRANGGPEREAAAKKAQDDADRAEIERLAK